MGAQEGYKKILKGTAIFGGVQVFQILISLIRGKMTALLIGVEGMGISTMFVSSLTMIITLAAMGCNLSAVKYISGYDKNSIDYIKKINNVQIIFIMLAILGAVITVLLSYFLSKASFQNTEYTVSYIILSIYVACSVYSSGCISILQGMQELKKIAIANVIPAAIGLFITIPLYYLWGLQAIVPVIIVVPLIASIMQTMILDDIYATYKYKPIYNVVYSAWKQFKEYASLGIVTVLASLIGNITAYGINTAITRLGTIKDVGLFQAGTSITNQYVGLVFSAMSMDYLPRLSQVIEDKNKMNDTVNNQGEIVALFALPALAVMMVTAPYLIQILLSDEFVTVVDFIRIMAYGMMIQALYFPMSYIPFAKGDKKVFIYYEGIFSNVIHFLFLVVGFYCMGLVGTAIGNTINNVISFIVSFYLAKIKYRYKMSKNYFSLCVLSVLLLSIELYFSSSDTVLYIVISWTMSIVICIWSFCELNKRIKIIDIVKRKMKGNII